MDGAGLLIIIADDKKYCELNLHQPVGHELKFNISDL